MVEESRVPELTNTPRPPVDFALAFESRFLDFSTARLLDFLTLSFVFINIPGLFRKKALDSQLSAVSLPLALLLTPDGWHLTSDTSLLTAVTCHLSPNP